MVGEKERKMYMYVVKDPGASQSQICKYFRVSQQSGAFTLGSLEGAGLLKKTKDGRRSIYNSTGLADDSPSGA